MNQAMKTKKITGLAMHVHHDMLFEHCFDYAERVEIIKTTKPGNEILTRLKLFKMLTEEAISELPKNIIKVETEWLKIYTKWLKTEIEHRKAYTKYHKAWAECKKVHAEWSGKEAWHKKHCGCTEWDGKKINYPLL